MKSTNWKADTRYVHAGAHPDPSTGAIMTPIYQTSTYVQEAPGVNQGFEYARSQNPTRKALEEALDPETVFERVVIVRSAVPSREIGHLPGDEKEKTEVYQLPYVEICEDLFNHIQPFQRLQEQKSVNFMITSFVRGITLDNSIVIVDECQNLNFHELDTIITRVGQDSKIMFCGDFFQTDLVKSSDKSGLTQFMKILDAMEAFENIEFTIGDIVRSGFVKEYLINKIRLGVE